jgi:hypothetical protein
VLWSLLNALVWLLTCSQTLCGEFMQKGDILTDASITLCVRERQASVWDITSFSMDKVVPLCFTT